MCFLLSILISIGRPIALSFGFSEADVDEFIDQVLADFGCD